MRIISEDYQDLIYEYNNEAENVIEKYEDLCVQYVSDKYVCLYIDPRVSPELSIEEYSYTAIPKLYGLMNVSAVEATGALRLQNLTGFELTGSGVIVGFVDTGIDYRNDAFRYTTGQTRIVGIWDQTIQGGNPPEGFYYGTEYDRIAIDEALMADNPLSVVPHRDENGHGTFLAGVACGTQDVENSFIGAAPGCEIAMVKLKKAKNYLREFFFATSTDEVYQENDIMLGVRYLRDLAIREGKPLVVVVGLGSSFGDHSGGAPLPQILDELGNLPGYCVVSCGGNEGNERLHYRGVISENIEYEDVEIRVGENQNGFVAELWGQTPDVFSVALISPQGESVPRIPARIGNSEKFDFLLEDTRVSVDYRIVESGNGAELVFMRFEKPTAGVWTIRVYGNNLLEGTYNIWLPLRDFVGEELFFLEPQSETTITEPGNARNVITVAAYNNRNDSIYAESGRGFTVRGEVKPDLSAPGVAVYGPATGPVNEKRYVERTGTSISAAFVGGICAQFLEWGIVRGNEPYMKTVYVKNFLIRGADRSVDVKYPNRQWGYGIVDAYEAFRILTTT